MSASVLPPPTPPAPFTPTVVPVTPTPAPATIPISFTSDPSAPSGQIVSFLPVATGIPYDESVSGVFALPLAPLPTAVGATVRVPQGAAAMDYQTAGNNLLESAMLYSEQLTVYAPALATLLASDAYAAYVAAGETQAAFDVLFATSDYQTWLVAFTTVSNGYLAYIATYNAAQSALNWWNTYAAAVNYWNRYPLSANPFSSTNPI